MGTISQTKACTIDPGLAQPQVRKLVKPRSFLMTLVEEVEIV